MTHPTASEFLFVEAGTAGRARPATAESTGGYAIEVSHRLEDALVPWRLLARTGAGPVYQSYEWTQHWMNEVGRAEGVRPVIVIGRRGGVPSFLWPMGLRRQGGVGVVSWLGGKHANYNFGLIAPDAARDVGPAEVRRWFTTVARQTPGADLFVLCNQPETWEGVPNPLHRLGGREAASHAYRTSLAGGFEAVLARHNGAKKRKKLRWQTNALADVGGFRFIAAEDAATAHAILDAFAAQKSARLQAQGISNAFARPGVMGFFHALVEDRFRSGRPLIEVFAVEIAGSIRATFAGGVHGNRFSGYFNSIAEDEFARVSPGELLLYHVIEACCRRGLDMFDLGLGEARYKASWCDGEDRMFETVLPVSLAGRAVAPVLTARTALKRRLRNNQSAWGLIKAARRRLAPQG